MITNHPEEQVDSFILHVKAAMLLSRVKVFNGRYKMKRHHGDPTMQPDPSKAHPHIPFEELVTTSPAFIELDRLVLAFRDSFPSHLRDPTENGQIDVSLLTALSSAHL